MNGCKKSKDSLKAYLENVNIALYLHFQIKLIMNLNIIETVHSLMHDLIYTFSRQTLKPDGKGFILTLQEARSIYDSMNIPKIELIS